MQVSSHLLAEIYSNMEHGEIQSIASQLGLKRTKVNRELTTLKSDYDEIIITTAINRLTARGVELKHKK